MKSSNMSKSVLYSLLSYFLRTKYLFLDYKLKHKLKKIFCTKNQVLKVCIQISIKLVTAKLINTYSKHKNFPIHH